MGVTDKIKGGSDVSALSVAACEFHGERRWSIGVSRGFTPLCSTSNHLLRNSKVRSAEAVLNSNQGEHVEEARTGVGLAYFAQKRGRFGGDSAAHCVRCGMVRAAGRERGREMGGGKVEPPYYDGSTAAAHLFFL